MSNDEQRRKTFWEDEEEDDVPSLPKAGSSPGAPRALDSGAIDLKIQEARALMEQTHQLYQHFFNGIEKRPPAEKARLLESRIRELERLGSPSTASRFKVSQFILQYNTFKDLWEKKLRDRERK